MSESSEVVGGGTSAAATAVLEVSVAPVEERGGGTLLEDLERLKGQLSDEQPSVEER